MEGEATEVAAMGRRRRRRRRAVATGAVATGAAATGAAAVATGAVAMVGEEKVVTPARARRVSRSTSRT